MTEDEMVGWHHLFNGHEFEQTLGHSEGQGSLACYSPWGCQKSDMTQRLNNNNNLQIFSPNLVIVSFALLIVSFVVQKLLSLIRSHLFIFAFQYSGRWVIEDPAVIYVRKCKNWNLVLC